LGAAEGSRRAVEGGEKTIAGRVNLTALESRELDAQVEWNRSST
jgi:hypothetical protein